MMNIPLKIFEDGWLGMLIGVAYVRVCKLTDEQIKAYHEVAKLYGKAP